MPRRDFGAVLQRIPLFRQWGTGTLDARAAAITDPIERLRYLRERAPALALSTEPPQRRFQWDRRWSFAAAIVAVLVPLQAVSDARDSMRLYVPASVPVEGRLAYEGDPERYPNIWLVDSRPDEELYSNGLRVEVRHAVANRPRSYYRLDRSKNLEISKNPYSEPAGIVFHTTESLVAPFQQENTARIRRAGQALIDYIASQRSYHYLIDRFGRVFRIVQERDAAHHAGLSVWADARYGYLNLNDPFLGVAFEGTTQPEGMDRAVTDAQIHSARVLTEMLRSRYRIPMANCITHAQVSVNPLNREVGFHHDWGRNLPFGALGLPNNYLEPLAATYLFGFIYTPNYLSLTNESLWAGLRSADQTLKQQAHSRNLTVSQYQDQLFDQYRRLRAQMRAKAESEEASEGKNVP